MGSQLQNYRIRREIRRAMPENPIIRGTVGKGDGTIEVAGLNNYIWVTINGIEMTVFNNRIAPFLNAPVIVGNDELNPNLVQVLDYNYGADGHNYPPALPKHGDTHRYYGGSDVTWIDLRQFLPLCPFITGNFEITVYTDYFPATTGWVRIDTTAIDLTDHVPTTTGYRYTLIYVDTLGLLQILDGPVTSTVGLVNIPETPGGCFPICAVRLYKYQTKIDDTNSSSDLLDLRWPQLPGGAGSSGDLNLEDLGDVTITEPQDLDLLTYDAASQEWVNRSSGDSALGGGHLHASLETFGDGSQTDFILPNLYGALTTEVFINGLRQRFPVEWDEIDEDTIRFATAPLAGDVIAIDYVAEETTQDSRELPAPVTYEWTAVRIGLFRDMHWDAIASNGSRLAIMAYWSGLKNSFVAISDDPDPNLCDVFYPMAELPEPPGSITNVPGPPPGYYPDWTDLTSDGSQFLALHRYDAFYATSPDGLTWTERALPFGDCWWYFVIWNGSIFLATTYSLDDRAAISANGVDWTEVDLGTDDYRIRPAWNGSLFFIPTVLLPQETPSNVSNEYATSPDGINWTPRALPVSRRWSDPIANGSAILLPCAYDHIGEYLLSTDGINWETYSMPRLSYWTYGSGGGYFCALNGDVDPIGAISTDGINWTTFPLPDAKNWTDIVWHSGDSSFYAVSTDEYGVRIRLA